MKHFSFSLNKEKIRTQGDVKDFPFFRGVFLRCNPTGLHQCGVENFLLKVVDGVSLSVRRGFGRLPLPSRSLKDEEMTDPLGWKVPRPSGGKEKEGGWKTPVKSLGSLVSVDFPHVEEWSSGP